MVRNVGFWMVATLLLPCAAAAQPFADNPFVDDGAVVATVDGVPVRAGHYRSTYFEYLTSTGNNDTPRSRSAHLNSLIDTYLLAGEARARGLAETPAFEEFAERRFRQLVGSRYFARAFLDSLAQPSEAALREAYRRSKETRRLRHLFFRDAGRAQAAYERLQKGEDFVLLANEIFQTPRPDSLAGMLGSVGYWDLDAAVAEAAYATPVGSYSAPVRSRYGWHIVRVEDRVYQPLLIESDFQARKAKLAAQVRERTYRLEGNRVLEEMLGGIDLEMNAEGLRLLQETVRRLASPIEAGAPDVALDEREVADIQAALTPETVLATYRFDGQPYTLTAGTYARYLPDLPGREARTRTAASVGRVLRDEVLAERGFAAGLDRDSVVMQDFQALTATYLAQRLSERLSADTTLVPTDEELQRAFVALGYDRIESATATFWTATYDDATAAEQVRQRLKEETVTPSALESYTAYQDADLTALGELGRHVRLAPLNQTVLLGLADGRWVVLHVSERAMERGTLEARRTLLTRAIRPYLGQLRLLSELRAEAEIEIDWDVVEAALPSLDSVDTSSNSNR